MYIYPLCIYIECVRYTYISQDSLARFVFLIAQVHSVVSSPFLFAFSQDKTSQGFVTKQPLNDALALLENGNIKIWTAIYEVYFLTYTCLYLFL